MNEIVNELLEEMRNKLAATERERDSAANVAVNLAATVHSLETQARMREADLQALETRRGEYLAKMQEQLATVTRERDEALRVVAELQPEVVLERESALLDRAEKAERERDEALRVVAAVCDIATNYTTEPLPPEMVLEREAALLDRAEKAESERDAADVHLTKMEERAWQMKRELAEARRDLARWESWDGDEEEAARLEEARQQHEEGQQKSACMGWMTSATMLATANIYIVGLTKWAKRMERERDEARAALNDASLRSADDRDYDNEQRALLASALAAAERERDEAQERVSIFANRAVDIAAERGQVRQELAEARAVLTTGLEIVAMLEQPQQNPYTVQRKLSEWAKQVCRVLSKGEQ